MKRLALLLLAGCASDPSVVDKPASPFELPATDGSWVALDDYAGRVVVLNFWAEWCGSCEGELQQFQRMADDNPDVAFIGVAHASGSLQEVSAFAERAGLRFPILLGDGDVQRRYGISVFPTTLVIGRDGRVRHRVFGPRERDVWDHLLATT